MFGFEYNEEEERKALLEIGEERGKARGKIDTLLDLIRKGLLNLNELKTSGDCTDEELSAIELNADQGEPSDSCQPLHENTTDSTQGNQLSKENLSIREAVQATADYCSENNIMGDYLKNNKNEIIDMFANEWEEEERRQSLIKAGEVRGEARGRINTLRNLVLKGLVNISDLKTSGDYTPEELAAIAKSI